VFGSNNYSVILINLYQLGEHLYLKFYSCLQEHL
jgi:hypothetical protein